MEIIINRIIILNVTKQFSIIPFSIKRQLFLNGIITDKHQFYQFLQLNILESADIIFMNQHPEHTQAKTVIFEPKNKHHSHFKNSWLHRLLYRGDDYAVFGPESESFNRRHYEKPIESLVEVDSDTVGFTNRVLKTRDSQKNQTLLFVPTYISLKVKSIQQIDIKDLIASINCVLIIYVYVEGLSKQIAEIVEKKMMVQINRGKGLLLHQNQEKTNIKFQKRENFYRFIIRDIFPVQIYEDIFLSPFQILNLVLSVTFKSINVPAQQPGGQSIQISFNCMRNPEIVPINYVTQCKLGVYDLAERLLSCYHSNLATYDEIKDKFYQFVEGKKKKEKKYLSNELPIKFYNIKSPRVGRKMLKLAKFIDEPVQNLEIGANIDPLKQKEKIKYFQYSHFVVPVYKYPGNTWATIFIPVFMLAALSISIFFSSADLHEKVGSIATLVLGFIALIPSIKEQLPPSQSITISEIIVYTEAVNCMLSLANNFIVNTSKKQFSVWNNKIFMISLFVHLVCLGVAIFLLVLHKLVWQKRYNIDAKCYELDPVRYKKLWNNPYCDEYFLNYNKGVREANSNKSIQKNLFEEIQPIIPRKKL